MFVTLLLLQHTSLLILMAIKETGSLTLTSIDFPSHVMLGQSVSMKCSYSKLRDQQIDSIKWYKDGGEFYRVHPRLEGRQDVRQFSVSGVQVDTNNTGLTHTGRDTWQHSVNIVNTKLATSGTFRCQITEANAPFHTEQQDRNITVIIQPEGSGPRMSVNPKVATVGQEVEVKCWSDRSHPAASLQFYLNGNRVKDDSMGVMEIFRESDGILQSSFRKMRLVVRESHSEAGVVNVKCNANIGEAYWQTSQLNINVVNKPSFKLQSRSHSNSDFGNSHLAALVILSSQVLLCK